MDFIEFRSENLTRIVYFCNITDSQLCNITEAKQTGGIYLLGAPATFFISLVHVLLSLILALIIFFNFNSVRVLGKKTYTSSTSSIWWLLFLSVHCCEYLPVLLLLPVYTSDYDTQKNIAYFLLNTLHVVTYFFLCGALDHEWRFRTTATATLTINPYSLRSKLRSIFRYFINWSRLLFFFQTLVLISISIILGLKREDSILSILLICYTVALVLMQCTVYAIGLAVLCKNTRHSKPSSTAMIILLLALILQTAELLPIFFINGFVSKDFICIMAVLTPFDLLRIISLIPLVLYCIFVAIEYKRVEAMNKYNIIADLQALLQFQK